MSVNVYKNGGLVSIAGNGAGSADFVGTRAEVQAALPTLSEGTTIYITDDVSPDGLPLATTTKPGVVQPDGNTINVDQNGIISAAAEVPIATTTTAGKVKPDGTTISVSNDGTISGASPTPIATTAVAGKVKPDGTTININSSGTISANTSVPVATTSTIGGIKASNTTDVSVDSAGALSIDPYNYKLDRRKVFAKGVTNSGAALVGNKSNFANNTIYDMAQVYYSGIYLIKLQSISQEKIQGGTINLYILNGNNEELMTQSFTVCCPCAQGSYTSLLTLTMYHTTYAIAPLQQGTYVRAKATGTGTGNSSGNTLVLWGWLLYEFTNSTVDTSHWWNNSNIIS